VAAVLLLLGVSDVQALNKLIAKTIRMMNPFFAIVAISLLVSGRNIDYSITVESALYLKHDHKNG
ncbi:hypothetical protein K0U00_14315, partial [Paenibacillus sepulcri]|nr:hypothetical protein [Paenibacillus sepulcri]